MYSLFNELLQPETLEKLISELLLFSRFLVADKRLYKRLCPSVRWSVGRLVRGDRVEKWENERFRYVCVGLSVGDGFGC